MSEIHKGKILKHLGERVREAREAKGWTQAQLAVYSGALGPPGLSQVETGKRNPSVVSLMLLAEALEVDVADLFPSRIDNGS